MTRAGCLLAFALAAAGCNEGNELATGAFDFSQPGDSGNLPQDDLSAAPVDMAAKSCGQIVTCAIQCGTTNATCIGMCFTGASPTGLLQAGALVACAAQNCLTGGDGGAAGGGMAGVFQCLITNCQMQIAGCPGLFPAPM